MNSEQNAYLVADLFCGAGGSSTGAKRAIEKLGRKMRLVAVNHWALAIKTHQHNHPEARHIIEDVSIADPEAIVPEGRLDLLMASPECTYHSRARGGKPIHDQGRMNPWAIHNWLTKLDVQRVLVENVPEFVRWGPLDANGKLDKQRQGSHFEAWFLTFLSLGYQAEWRMLNAADHGDATSRTRFFLQARNDGQPILWPEPTHTRHEGPTLTERLPRWRGAREIIQWENQGRSLMDDPKYRRKPLSAKTRRRIAKGLSKFGGPLAHLYIRLLDLPESEDRLPAASQDTTFVLNRHGDTGYNRCHPVSDPTPTVTCRGAGYIVTHQAEPLCGAGHDRAFLIGQQSMATPRSVDQPVPTIATAGAISITKGLVVNYYKQSDCTDPDNPLPSITAQGRKHALAQPVIVEYYTNSDCSEVAQPLPTVTTRDRHALCLPTALEIGHAAPDRDPVPVSAGRGGMALAEPVLIQIDHRVSYDTDYGRTKTVDKPVRTPLTKPILSPAQPTATAAGNGHRPRQDAPNTLTDSILQDLQDQGIDPRRLVMIDDVPHLLDIRFRMLQNSELARAMGFSDAESEYEFSGTVKEVTKQIGNAIPVNLAEALVTASLSP